MTHIPINSTCGRVANRPGRTSSAPSAQWRRIRTGIALLCGAVSSLTPVLGQAFVAEWTASGAGTISPTGVAFASEAGVNYVYVSDHLGGRIIKFNAGTGSVAAVLGSQGSGNGQFKEPYGLALDPASGDLYVAERGNHRVQRITSSGAFVMAWGGPGTAPGQFNEPIGVAVDASGAVYVTEHSNHRVQKFQITQGGGTWSAANLATWGSQGSGNGQFNVAYGVAIDATGNVWVADGFNGRVQRFSADGTYQGTIGSAGTAPGQFVVPTGVTVDSAGSVFVTSTNPDPQNGTSANASSQWVSKFSSAGTFQSRFGGVHGSGPGEFRLPFFITLGAGNRAYVSDYYNNRVQVFDLAATPGGGSGGGGGGVDSTPPTVTGFTVAASTPTSVTFQITFSETVTGVDVTDFTAVTTGDAVATIGAVSGAGAIYTVQVGFTGTGTVRLNLNASGTGIADASANALAAGATGPTHTIGTAGGGGTTQGTRVTGVTVPADGTYRAGQELTFLVQFSGPVTVSAVRSEAKGNDDKKPKDDKDGKKDEDEDRNNGGGKGGNDDKDKDSRSTRDDDEDDEADDDDSVPYFTWNAVGAAGQRGASGKVAYVSGSGTALLTFRYKVHKDDAAPSGIQLGPRIELPEGAAIRNSAGVTLDEAARTLVWAQNPLSGVILAGGATSGGAGKGTGPVVVLKPVPGAVVGQPLTLPSATEDGVPITWLLVSGNAMLDGNVLTPSNKGAIVLRAMTVQGALPASGGAAEITMNAHELRADRLVNLSSRLRVADDADHSAIAGFVVTGAGEKPVLIRAVGPGLAKFGIRDALRELRLQLRDRTGAVIAENSGWSNDSRIAAAAARVGAFQLETGSGDSAMLLSLPPGAYTAQIVAEGSGITLVEVYDAGNGADLAAEQLGNISTRGFVGTGEGRLVAGFVVSGETPKRVLIRGVGPALAAFGVAGALADPVLTLYTTGAAQALAQNDNWGAPSGTTGSAAEVAAATLAAGAFPLPSGGKDAALLVSLPPGNYSAVLSGAGESTGIALIEVYEIPTP